MQRLLDANPGLTSRFPNKLHFADYTHGEMFQIGQSMLEADNLRMSDSKAKDAFRGRLEAQGIRHANGRSVRNILEEAKRNMAVRLTQFKKASATDLTTLSADDF